MQSDVEVLIVSYHSSEVVERCLASLHTNAPGIAVAIREHGDRDAERRMAAVAAGYAGPIRFEADPSNPGFGAGCNALANQSLASWLLFFNPDAELATWPWGDSQRPPQRTIVGPEMVDSGDPGRQYGVSYRVRDEVARSWLRRRGGRPNGSGFVSGAALLIDAASFRALGGFDEGYFMFYEDLDLCRRANRAGVSTIVDPTWTVRHRGAHSTSARFADSLMWSYESACRFHGQHGSHLVGYRIYVICDSAARALLAMVQRSQPRSVGYRRLARRATADLLRRH